MESIVSNARSAGPSILRARSSKGCRLSSPGPAASATAGGCKCAMFDARIPVTTSLQRNMRCLLIGVHGHGGEEVYSGLVRDHVPDWFTSRSVFGFHSSCEWGRCRRLHEVL